MEIDEVTKLKAALARAVEIDKELHARLEAVTRDRDERDVRHFNEMLELRRDRDNLRERLSINAKPTQELSMSMFANRDDYNAALAELGKE